ncbi:MAG TPA: cytochrome c [Bryobacteraceae bacterium]|nr:cytochrome c [Bryobacteraceae bacterium]
MRFLGLILWTAIVAQAAPTYHGEVKAVLDKRCTSCHQSGDIGPMTFRTYAETRPWVRAIRQAVAAGTMPPWHADPARSAAFHNDRSLSAAEKSLLLAWADAGAPEGAPSPAAPATPRAEGWQLGKPDLIIRVPKFAIPQSGTISYTFLVTPTHFAQAKWIAAAEWKIDQRSVVHHINAFVRPKGSSYVADAPPGQFFVASRESRAARRPDERESDRRELLLGYEPGYRPLPWGEGRAKLLPAGADIVFEMHYTANGKAVTDSSELGLYFTRDTPRERVLTITPADNAFAIPPGDANFPSATAATLKRELTLLSLQPHMHLRGKSYRITARYPDGRVEPLIDVPRYDFNWQTTYFLTKPKVLPTGTVLECLAHFDNSPNNRFNPDPAQTVRWGDQSWEEMNIGFMEVVFPANADPDVVALAGTTRPGSSTTR